MVAEPVDVDRDAGRDVLRVGLGQSVVAGVSRVRASDGLGDGALDAGAGVVGLFPRFAVLVADHVRSGGADRFWVDGDRAARVGIDGLGALCPQRTRAAVPHPEPEGDRAPGVRARGAAQGAGRAGGLPGVPVHIEVGRGEQRAEFGVAAGQHGDRAIGVMPAAFEAAMFAAEGYPASVK